jgi:endo-1,4-beta-xylanase
MKIRCLAILVLSSASGFGQTPACEQPLPLEPGAKVVPLWPAGSPTLRNCDQPEVFTPTKGNPSRVQKVVNINNPSIELHLAAKPNGLGMILAAGGGNTELNVGTEGTDIAKWLNGLGVSAFILRYRLRPYDSATDAFADTAQSIKTVRAHAREWGVDPARIGIMGFSAGGEQAARIVLNFDADSRPDVAVLVYAGWGKLDMTQVPKNAPPVFLTSAGIDDAFHARETVEFYTALFNAQIPVELHIYGHGGHANGISPRNGIPFGTWQYRFVEWITDLGMMSVDVRR